MSDFFLPMLPPTVTAQQHKVSVKARTPRFYDPPRLADARAKLEAYLALHRPDKPLEGAVLLDVKWCFPRGCHAAGSFRTTKPDTDNLNKLLKDCMTRVGFWRDDAQVAVELIEKRWSEIPGICIRVEELP